MTVFNDAVKLEEDALFSRKLIGWFSDEVSAISAAAEHILIQSALLSDLRMLPELVICSEYRKSDCKKKPLKFIRATRVKRTQRGRRVVMVPGIWRKSWVTM